MTMLTPAQVADVRASVEHAARLRRGHCTVRCIGGPLDGVEFPVDKFPTEFDTLIEWDHITEKGLIKVFYAGTELPGLVEFKGYEGPGEQRRGRSV